jgi:ubiquinol-cytochrome c reductase cytochrome c1 subunit
MTMMKNLLRPTLAAAAILGVFGAQPVLAAGEAISIPRKSWAFSGPGGHFDQAQLQRGFLIYKEVCASCHGLKRVAYRNLTQKGGPAFSEGGVRSLAAEAKIEEIDPSTGKVVARPGRLSDRLPSPYKNEAEARATHNGAYPPDLSLIAKGRSVEYTGSIWYHPISMARDVATGYQEAGADYLYALLTGYKDNAPAYRRDPSGRLVSVPESSVARGDKSILRCVSTEKGAPGRPDTCNELAEGMHYNTAFPGHQIGMANPLQADDPRLKFADGTPGTVSNYAADVAAFLSWAADPHHNERKDMGWQVMLYLLITAVLLYLTKKRIWRDAH